MIKLDKKKILFSVLILELSLGVAFIYFNYFASKKLNLKVTGEVLIENRTAILKEFLSSPGFQLLEEFGNLPINIGPAGKDNPF